MAKRKTAIQKAYTKERNRILSTVRRYKKSGLDVQFTVPEIPKKITAASVRRLQKITPKKIQEKTFGVDLTTGEQISYFKARKQAQAERKREKEDRLRFAKEIRENIKDVTAEFKAKPPKSFATPTVSDVIISKFLHLILTYPDEAYEIIRCWLDNQLAEYGQEAVAKMLQQSNDAGDWLQPRDIYKAGRLADMLSSMIAYLDISKEEKRQILDSVDEELSEWEELYF